MRCLFLTFVFRLCLSCLTLYNRQLDRIEGGYERVPCVVHPYASGTDPLAASVYRMYA